MDFHQAIHLAKTLMNQYGILCPLKISRGRRTTACVHWYRITYAHPWEPKYLALSKYYLQLNEEPDIRNSITHEIAHIKVGYGHGHDLLWQACHISMGGNGKRLVKVRMPEGHFVGVCPLCQKTYTKHRGGRRVLTSNWICSCGGRFRFNDTRIINRPVLPLPLFSGKMTA